jgi:hypothetical protein
MSVYTLLMLPPNSFFRLQPQKKIFQTSLHDSTKQSSWKNCTSQKYIILYFTEEIISLCVFWSCKKIDNKLKDYCIMAEAERLKKGDCHHESTSLMCKEYRKINETKYVSANTIRYENTQYTFL